MTSANGNLIEQPLNFPGWSQANTEEIGVRGRLDTGPIRHAFFERKDGKPIALRFNVENLFDLNYWASANAELGLAMGAPRTFLLSLSADF